MIRWGAQLSVGGVGQAKACCRSSQIQISLLRKKSSFRVGNTVHESIRIQIVRIPTLIYGHLQFFINIVPIDVPILLGLQELRLHSFLINYF